MVDTSSQSLVQLITKPSSSKSGTGRYTTNLLNALLMHGVHAKLDYLTPLINQPLILKSLSKIGLDINEFFYSYPIKIRHGKAGIYHLTTQTFGTSLLFNKFDAPVVITVHDILPFILRKDHELKVFHHFIDEFFYHLALKG